MLPERMHEPGHEHAFLTQRNLFTAILSVAAAADDFPISYLEGLQTSHQWVAVRKTQSATMKSRPGNR
jgi:hypothetical protein